MEQRPMEKKVDPLYGWVLVGVGTAIIAIINGAFYSYGVFFKPLLQDFGWSRAELSGPVSLRLAATGIFGILAGAIVDRAGPRLVVPAGVLLVAVGYALTSRVTGIWEMYLYMGLIIGVGMSVPYPALTALISRWFTAKRGLAMGIVLAGFGLGQVIFPPLVTRWIADYSWQTAFINLALIAGLCGVPLGFLLKSPVKEKKPPLDDPFLCGPPLGGKQESIAGAFKDGLRSLALWQISLVYLLFSACLQALMVHLVPHAIDVGHQANGGVRPDWRHRGGKRCGPYRRRRVFRQTGYKEDLDFVVNHVRPGAAGSMLHKKLLGAVFNRRRLWSRLWGDLDYGTKARLGVFCLKLSGRHPRHCSTGLRRRRCRRCPLGGLHLRPDK